MRASCSIFAVGWAVSGLLAFPVSVLTAAETPEARVPAREKESSLADAARVETLLGEHIAEAMERKELEPLDAALEELRAFRKAAGEGPAAPETRRVLLRSWLRLYQAVTGLIVPGFSEENHWGETGPLPPGWDSSYLYRYIQPAARVYRYQLRIDLFRNIPTLYAPENAALAREEILDAAAKAEVDAELCRWLEKLAFTVGRESFPANVGSAWGSHEERQKRRDWARTDLARLAVMEVCAEPLYIPLQGSFNISPPFGGVSRGGWNICGMDPEAVVDDEARRQYKVARRENARISKGYGMNSDWEKEVVDAKGEIYERLFRAYRHDFAGQAELFCMAASEGVSPDTLSDLTAFRLTDAVDEALSRYEEARRIADARAAFTLIETLPESLPKRFWQRPMRTSIPLNYFRDFKLQAYITLARRLSQDKNPEAARLLRDLEKSVLEYAGGEDCQPAAACETARLFGAPKSLRESLKELRKRHVAWLKDEAEALAAACAAGGGKALYPLAERAVNRFSWQIDKNDLPAREREMRWRLQLLAARKVHLGEKLNSAVVNLKYKFDRSEEVRALFLRVAGEFEALNDDVEPLRVEFERDRIWHDIRLLKEGKGDSRLVEEAVDRLPVRMKEGHVDVKDQSEKRGLYIDLLSALETNGNGDSPQAVSLRAKIMAHVVHSEGNEKNGRRQPSWFDFQDLLRETKGCSLRDEVLRDMERKKTTEIARWEELLARPAEDLSPNEWGEMSRLSDSLFILAFRMEEGRGDREKILRLHARLLAKQAAWLRVAQQQLNMKLRVPCRIPSKLWERKPVWWVADMLHDKNGYLAPRLSQLERNLEDLFNTAAAFFGDEEGRRFLTRLLNEEQAGEFVEPLLRRMSE